MAAHSEASIITLSDLLRPPRADLLTDRAEDIGAAMLAFLARMDQRHAVKPVRLPAQEGELDGISYRIQGAGAPLVLLPLGLAASQWEPLLPGSARQYCTPRSESCASRDGAGVSVNEIPHLPQVARAPIRVLQAGDRPKMAPPSVRVQYCALSLGVKAPTATRRGLRAAGPAGRQHPVYDRRYPVQLSLLRRKAARLDCVTLVHACQKSQHRCPDYPLHVRQEVGARMP